jgi:hypothetical protein
MTTKNQKPEANSPAGVTAVGSGDLLGLVAVSLMGYLLHLLQAIRQASLALNMRRELLARCRVGLSVPLNLIFLIIFPCLIQPAFGGTNKASPNLPHSRLNLTETLSANILQGVNVHIKSPTQSHAEPCRQLVVFVNDGVNPPHNDNVEIRNSLLKQMPARTLISTLSKRVNDKPPDNAKDADSNSNNNADGRPIHWDLLRWYHWLLLGWASFFTGAGMSAIWWLTRPNEKS